MKPQEHFKEIYELKRSYFYHLCHVSEYMMDQLKNSLVLYRLHMTSPFVHTPKVKEFFQGITAEMRSEHLDALRRKL